MKNKLKTTKVGYNWVYRFSTREQNGKVSVVIDEELWYRHRNGFEDHLLSGYHSRGVGRCEDAVCEKIVDAFSGLIDESLARDMIVSKGFFGPWNQYRTVVEGATLDDSLITGFARELASINRVSVMVANKS